MNLIPIRFQSTFRGGLTRCALNSVLGSSVKGLLVRPNPDAPTNNVTDASEVAARAVLQQLIDGEWHPIAYFSKKLKPQETRYGTFDRELSAIYLAVKHFQHFVEGRIFHVLTDHKPHTSALYSKVDSHSAHQILASYPGSRLHRRQWRQEESLVRIACAYAKCNHLMVTL